MPLTPMLNSLFIEKWNPRQEGFLLAGPLLLGKVLYGSYTKALATCLPEVFCILKKKVLSRSCPFLTQPNFVLH